MARAIFVTICAAIALFGASNASPTGFSQARMGYSSLTTHQILMLFRSQCIEMSGSSTGFDKMINSMHPALLCFAGHVDLMEFMRSVEYSPNTLEARQSLIDKYCPAFNESVACFSEVIEGMAMCSKDNVTLIKTMETKMVHNMIDLMCKNYGQFLIDVKTPEFRTCLNYAKQNVTQCKLSDIIKSMPLSQFGHYECSELMRTRTCIQGQLSSFCSTSALVDLVDVFVKPRGADRSKILGGQVWSLKVLSGGGG